MRFERQMPIFGEEGQQRIMSAVVGIIGHYLVVHEVGNPVLGFKLGPGAGGLADNAGLVEAEDAEYGGMREVGD